MKKSALFIAIFITVFLLLNGVAYVFAEPLDTLTGNCGIDGGRNVTWILEDSEGNGTYDRLVISGSGDMENYSYYGTQPWAVENGGDEGLFNDNLKTIIIQEGVTSIGTFAFGGYRAVETVSIPSTVTVICDEAFNNCQSLAEIRLSESLTEIGYGAFSYSGLKRLDIPESVTMIAGQAFCGTPLTEISIPEGVTEIGSQCFWGCVFLTEINLPKCITEIEEGAFRYCAFETIIIPEHVRKIGSGAFEDCDNLEAVILPKNLDDSDIDIPKYSAKIRYETTDNTLQITSIVLGMNESSVKIPETVGEKPIFIPKELTNKITFSSGETDIITKGICGDNLVWELHTNGLLCISGEGDMYDYFIYGNPAPWDRYKTMITGVEMSEKITYIGEDAFNGCYFTEVEFPDSVTAVGNGAFSNSKLVSVEFPDTITSVGDFMFWGCDLLETIVISSETKNIGTSVFDGCESLKILVVPENIIINDSFSENVSLVKYKIDKDGNIKIIEITGNEAIAIPSKIGGVPVVFVSEEYRDKVLESGHVHVYKNGRCEICKAVDPNHEHIGGTASCISRAVCKICNEEYGSLLGHIWNEGTDAKTPTCMETGNRIYACMICRKERTEDIARTEHCFVNGRCVLCKAVDPNHEHIGGTASCISRTVCKICNEEYGSLLGHTWNEGTDAKTPTCMETGNRIYACMICGKERTEDIARTEHHFVNGICILCKAIDPNASVPLKPEAEETKETDGKEEFLAAASVKTGDDRNPVLYAVCLALSAGTIYLCFYDRIFMSSCR